MSFIRPMDIQRCKHEQAPFTELGEFVYYRTYSRWLPDQKRREIWLETCVRAINYSMQLEYDHRVAKGLDLDLEKMQDEAGELLRNMYHLKQFPSGRTMWVGGTGVAKKFPMSNFNCSFLILDSYSAFSELFYLLMIGTGVGFRTMPYDVEKIPPYRTGVSVVHNSYMALEKNKRHDMSYFDIMEDIATIYIGDSKEGWVGALDIFFNLLTSFLYKDIKHIILNYDSVRPKGERLKTFGGTASGYQSLQNMFEKITKVLVRAEGLLEPIDVLDIANIIGENVVVGGVRRTSEINLASKDDMQIEHAKNGIYYMDENGDYKVNLDIQHRQMSNNSIFYESKPTREELHKNFINMRYTGERGFVNAEKGRKIRADFAGMNPCAEIMLADRGMCNLTTVNAKGFVYEEAGTYKMDYEGLFNAMKLSARMGLRMTLVDLEIQSWDEQQKKDRLLGCSVTGWMDAIDAVGMTKEEQKKTRAYMKRVILNEVKAYAEELGVNIPLLSTTVKPEGTISQLPTVSSGLHNSHSPFYIRRVRINASDPLVNVVNELGWDIQPENGQTWENATTLVVSFPVKTTAKKTKGQVSAIEQLENYKDFMEDYVEHNASITVHVRDNEWELVEQWIWDNWDDFVAVSFLPYSDSIYQQAPYEEITEEHYNEMKSKMKSFDRNLLSKYELQEEELDIGSDGCESGACPVR